VRHHRHRHLLQLQLHLPQPQHPRLVEVVEEVVEGPRWLLLRFHLQQGEEEVVVEAAEPQFVLPWPLQLVEVAVEAVEEGVLHLHLMEPFLLVEEEEAAVVVGVLLKRPLGVVVEEAVELHQPLRRMQAVEVVEVVEVVEEERHQWISVGLPVQQPA
jgi:hypothetical protein